MQKQNKLIIKKDSRDFEISEKKYYNFKLKDRPDDLFCCQIKNIQEENIYPSLAKFFCYKKRNLSNISDINNKKFFNSNEITSIDNIKLIDVPFDLFQILKKN